MDDPSTIIRFPIATDRNASFAAGGGLAGHFSWEEALDRHDPAAGVVTLVAEIAGEVVGVATVIERPQEIYVEFLARNVEARAARGLPVGSLLLQRALEHARALGLRSLTLESLDEPALLAFYERNGFVRDGPPFYDAVWGVLHPMRMPSVRARAHTEGR